jgi:hypothetical protein
MSDPWACLQLQGSHTEFVRFRHSQLSLVDRTDDVAHVADPATNIPAEFAVGFAGSPYEMI